MSRPLDADFGKLRSFIWPIHAHENKKLVPMLLMLFLICFNYSIMRNMKDSVVITASGAEVIPFIKVWVMLPMAVLLTYAFTKLSNRYSQERVFYIIISGFLLCFALFAFVLYPMRESLHPNEAANHLEKILPSGFKGLISMYRHWTYTGFYVICELWGSIVLSVLFWGFANEVTRIGEARRFYSVFGIGSNIAAILAGQSANYFNNAAFNPSLGLGRDAWEQCLMIIVMMIIVTGLTTMGLFYWLNRRVLNDPSFDELHSAKREIKTKKKLSLRDSMNYLSNSKYLICIAVIVVSYNLVIHLVEVVWKDQLRRLYPEPKDFYNFVNNLTSMMGVVSTITSLFMARIIGKFGWTRTALVTPFILLITSVGFFSFVIFQDHLTTMAAVTGITPLAIAVFFGAAQNGLSKAAKYSVFDTTKEMAFIPLDHESKLKGKAAIDGVGSRLGKSGGSLIHQGLLMFFATLSASAPYVGVILLCVIAFWIASARSLGRKFNDLVASQRQGVAFEEKAALAPEVIPPQDKLVQAS
jgi:ATP:ADP antiporter, AAA family